MFVKYQLSNVIILLILVTAFVGCGGTKQTPNYDPSAELFPAVEEEPQTKPEPLGPPDKAVDVSDLEKSELLVLLTVYFDFNKYQLSDDTKSVLAENARRLQKNRESSIRIEGHCDERGTVEFNLALGERRAMAVKNYLVNFGISPSRMTIISYGKERPLDPRHSTDAWNRNRRAEFVILN